jgi:hypothetical protein
VYCGYIGGSEDDGGYGVALDDTGNAFYSGWAHSDESSFPVATGPDLTHNGDSDGYVAKVNPQGSGFIYCGYIGGSEGDTCFGIALDDANRAHVIGNTFSDETSFPVLIGPDLTYADDADAFVARVDAQGSQLEYCGYVGGDRKENGLDICVDAQGDAYVIGWTHSDQNSFPVKAGPDLTFNGGSDIFVARIDSSGSGVVFSGYLGGAQEDYGLGIKLDPSGKICLGGGTYSDEQTFPVKYGPDLVYNGSGWDVGDVWVARLDPQDLKIDFCGYVGGDVDDGCYAIDVDGDGNIYAAGWTLSHESSFPAKTGPDLTYGGGTQWVGDGHLAKVAPPSLTADAETLPESGGTVNFFLDAGATNAGRNYLLLGSVSGTEPGYPLPGGLETLPMNWDGVTGAILLLLNTSLCFDFLGTLDGSGQAVAQLNLPALPAGSAGATLCFAFCLNGPFDYASNSALIEIVD